MGGGSLRRGPSDESTPHPKPPPSRWRARRSAPLLRTLALRIGSPVLRAGHHRPADGAAAGADVGAALDAVAAAGFELAGVRAQLWFRSRHCRAASRGSVRSSSPRRRRPLSLGIARRSGSCHRTMSWLTRRLSTAGGSGAGRGAASANTVAGKNMAIGTGFITGSSGLYPSLGKRLAPALVRFHRTRALSRPRLARSISRRRGRSGEGAPPRLVDQLAPANAVGLGARRAPRDECSGSRRAAGTTASTARPLRRHRKARSRGRPSAAGGSFRLGRRGSGIR